jgi:predicted ArsR family transcriptional regulator
MFRANFHPNAFLNSKKNIQPGLVARTKILAVLEAQIFRTTPISKKAELSYSVVLYHLHLLETENIVRHRGRRKYIWELTGAGQQRLVNAF